MKKISSIVLLVLILTACGSTKDTYENIADSAVHDYHTVSLEEITNERDNSEDNTDNMCIDINDDGNIDDNSNDSTTEIYDVWDMGLCWYGISYLDTTRTLKLITYEGYGYSPLSYYVACCCWVRATEGYWGYDNLYQAFGEADTSYDEWMDGLGIADWAYDALDECYRNPTYCMYCNGMAEPYDYIYAEWSDGDGCMIYCWND